MKISNKNSKQLISVSSLHTCPGVRVIIPGFFGDVEDSRYHVLHPAWHPAEVIINHNRDPRNYVGGPWEGLGYLRLS